jgi:hypothetical protein
MKNAILLFFTLIVQFCNAQNYEVIKKEAMLLFNNGKITEALNSLEQVKDVEILENTDINTWKKHFKNILDYKFSEKFVVNDSIKIVHVNTSLLFHSGIYNSNTKKYLSNPIYDDILNIESISKYFIVTLNQLNGLIDLSGKIVVPLGDYEINMNIYHKFISVVSRDGISINDLYNWDGKLIGNNIRFYKEVKQNYIITQNNLNKFQLLNTNTGQFEIEDCDTIENVSSDYEKPYRQEIFIKKDNNRSVYNFISKNYTANNDFDKIIVYHNYTNVFSNNLIENNGDKVGKEVFEKSKLIIVLKNSKFGIFDLVQKKYNVEPIYDSINNYGNCLKNNIWRNLKYEYPINEDHDYWAAAVIYKKNNLFGLKSKDNKTITEAVYDEVLQKSARLFHIKKQKLWGWILVGENKTTIVKPQFDNVYEDYDEKYQSYFQTCFKNETKKFSFEGKELQNTIKNPKEYVNNDWSYAPSKPNRRLTVIEKKADPEHGIFIDENLYGLDDKMGNEIVKPIYREIDLGLNNQQYLVANNSGAGIIDENGKIIIPTEYRSINYFNDNYYIIEKEHNYGLFDTNGKVVIPIEYKEIQIFLDGLYIVKDKDDVCKIIDANNEIIYYFPVYCEKISEFEKITSSKGELFYKFGLHFRRGYEGWYDLILVQIENNWGSQILEKYKIKEIYDNKIIQLVYKNKTLIGFYNLDNEKIIQPTFKEIIYNHQKKLIYCKTDKYFDTIIDDNLNIASSKNQITNIVNNLILYEKEGKYGFFDKNNQKTKNTFQDIDLERPIYLSNQILYKYYDNTNKTKGGIIDENGNIIVKSNLYDQINDFSTSNEIIFPDTKFDKKELEKILIGKDNSNNKRDKIDFFTLFGNKIASMNVPKNNYTFDFIFKKGITILQAPNEIIFFNLIEKKIVLKINASKLIKNNDEEFIILKEDSSIVDPKKILAQKYSIKGKLIWNRIVDRAQDVRSIENVNNNFIQKKDNKYGFVGVDEKTINPFVYDSIIPSIYNTYIVKKNNKFGIMDHDNNILLNIEYDKVDTEGLSEYDYRSERSYLDRNTSCDKRAPPRTSYNFIVSKNNKIGIVDINLKSILSVAHESYRKNRYLFENIIAKKGNYSIVYNAKGNLLFQIECDSLSLNRNYYPANYTVYKNNKRGFLNDKGVEIFPIMYTKVEKTKFGNLYILEKDTKKYIVNSKGEIISKAYDEINTTKFYNHFEVILNNKSGLMNNKGKIVIPEIYDYIGSNSGEITENTVGVVNDEIFAAATNYTLIALDGKVGIIDLSTEKNNIIPIKIPLATRKIYAAINNKYIVVSGLGKVGVSDFNNKIIIPTIYDWINYEKGKNYFTCSLNNIIKHITSDNVVIKVEVKE